MLVCKEMGSFIQGSGWADVEMTQTSLEGREQPGRGSPNDFHLQLPSHKCVCGNNRGSCRWLAIKVIISALFVIAKNWN